MRSGIRVDEYCRLQRRWKCLSSLQSVFRDVRIAERLVEIGRPGLSFGVGVGVDFGGVTHGLHSLAGGQLGGLEIGNYSVIPIQ